MLSSSPLYGSFAVTDEEGEPTSSTDYFVNDTVHFKLSLHSTVSSKEIKSITLVDMHLQAESWIVRILGTNVGQTVSQLMHVTPQYTPHSVGWSLTLVNDLISVTTPEDVNLTASV